MLCDGCATVEPPELYFERWFCTYFMWADLVRFTLCVCSARNALLCAIHPGLMPYEVPKWQKQAVFMPDSPRLVPYEVPK